MADKFQVAEGDNQWLKKNVNCQFNCPVDTNVPEYIEKITQGRYGEAYEINRHSNVLPGVLGRICTHPCEDICRRCLIDEPIAIRDLKRVSADFGFKDARPVINNAGKLGTKVAVIGGGPAGITVGRDLAASGHSVTIYEKEKRPGGMLWAGIPDYRLPREVTDSEVEANIVAAGVEIKYGMEVGKDVLITDLLKQYDSVVMCNGTWRGVNLDADVANANAKGVVNGLQFMYDYNTGNMPDVGRRVVVLGGGFTSVDCARSAVRIGAEKSYMLYRRTYEEMGATEEEIKLMEPEGVEVKYLTSPKSVVADDAGNVTGIEMIRNRLGDYDSSGRRKAVPVPGSEYTIECDMVVVAFGQKVDNSFLHDLIGDKRNTEFDELKIDKRWGTIDRDEQYCMTNIPGLFTCGDFFTGASDVIHAMGEAHKVAIGIDQWLQTRAVPTQDLQAIPIKRPRFATGYDGVKRQHQDILSLAKRKQNPFEEVELGLTREQGRTEASRCLLCQNNIDIDPDLCILCGLCVEACPYDVLYMIPATNVVGDKPGVLPDLNRQQKQDFGGMLLDEKRCIRCGLCVDACPTDAITFIKLIDKSVSYREIVPTAAR